MQNFKHDVIQDEPIDIPSHDTSAAEWKLFLSK